MQLDYHLWCVNCGQNCAVRWAACNCNDPWLIPFPDQDVAQAAYKLGGHEALFAMEQQMFAQLTPESRTLLQAAYPKRRGFR